MIRVAREWRCNSVLMHFNCGCEGTSVGLPENRAVLIHAGVLLLPLRETCETREKLVKRQFCAEWVYSLTLTEMSVFRIDTLCLRRRDHAEEVISYGVERFFDEASGFSSYRIEKHFPLFQI